ncbi:hypothetical protein JCM3774_001769 [Rhodotorula dairenensis]
MAQPAHRRYATWSGTVKDWLFLNWRALDADEGRGEMDALSDANREATHSDNARDCTDAVARVMSQCSTSDGQPVLVVLLCRIPDPSKVPAPVLLETMRLRLEETAARYNPYSIVVFLDPAPAMPPFRDLLSAYFRLSRLAKKNVQPVYLVGGGWRTSFLVRIFSTSILSLKAIDKGKLVECPALSQLAAKIVRLDLAPDGPYLAASLLKRHLTSMCSPIFDEQACTEARRCPLNDDAAVEFIRASILPLLSPLNRRFLAELVAVLARIANNATQNLMTASNLVICLCPALAGGIGASLEDIAKCRLAGSGSGSGTTRGLTDKNTIGGVLRVMIERYDQVFPPE